MRRFIVIGSAVAALVCAVSAFAAVPSQRTVFKGVTSEHAVNGYKPTIQFVAQPGGTITNFVFQTLGCFGSGTFPVGVDPFAETPWKLPRITRAEDGRAERQGQRDVERAGRREDVGHGHGHVHEHVEDDGQADLLAGSARRDVRTAHGEVRRVDERGRLAGPRVSRP